MTIPKFLFPLLVGILLIVIGMFIQDKIHTCPVPEVAIDTVIVYETVIDTQIVPEFTEVVYYDTITYRDTILIKENVNYIAQMDTIYRQDSLLQLKVQYISPSPLDKRSYFSIDAKVKEKIVTQTVHIIKTETYNSDFFIEAGALVNTQLNYYGQLGVNIISARHLKIPLSYEISVFPETKANHSVKAGLRIEF